MHHPCLQLVRVQQDLAERGRRPMLSADKTRAGSRFDKPSRHKWTSILRCEVSQVFEGRDRKIRLFHTWCPCCTQLQCQALDRMCVLFALLGSRSHDLRTAYSEVEVVEEEEEKKEEASPDELSMSWLPLACHFLKSDRSHYVGQLCLNYFLC